MPDVQALYYECFSGISGDMHIGAMVDLGVPIEYLQTELAKLSIANEFELTLCRDKRRGISGTRATVNMAPNVAKPHRHLRHIEEIIRSANYAKAITERALAIFQHIAVAEAAVHDIAIEKVHFHEVGATDSIVDIVAAALCLEHLKVDRVYCGEIELGGGMVRCDHGLMPVPAPATAAILTGIPCHQGRVDSEATTPTGAAILRAAVTDFRVPAHYTAQRYGYGVGQKDFEIANVLRLSLGTVTSDEPQTQVPPDFYQTETNVEVQCNLDDMTGEAFQPLLNALWALPVLDVFIAPIQMKKQRPAHKLTVLCSAAHLDLVQACLFDNSTTLGVRMHEVTKVMLPRESKTVQTQLGPIEVKLTQTASGQRRWKVEHDQLLALDHQGRPYPSIVRQVEREVDKLLNDETPQDDDR